MGKIYARAIMSGSHSINDVPKLWLTKTLDAFDGFVKSGEITVDDYERYVGKPYSE